MRVWRSSCWVLARAGGRRQTVRSGWHCSSPQLERYVQRCDPLRKNIRSTSCGTDTGGPTSKSSICVRMPSPTSLRVSDTSCLASRTISDLNASNEPDCASPTTAYYAVAHRTLLWISVTCCIMHDVCTCFATCCGLCYIGLCYMLDARCCKSHQLCDSSLTSSQNVRSSASASLARSLSSSALRARLSPVYPPTFFLAGAVLIASKRADRVRNHLTRCVTHGTIAYSSKYFWQRADRQAKS